jgi:Protein-L-isoaspartate(D-aspartate) O-methyltransferase (PCMT)
MSLFSQHVWPRIRWLYLRMRATLSHAVDSALGVRTTMDETAASEQPFDPSKKPSAWLTPFRVFHWLGVGPNDTMVDIGSGAGRAVLVASLFPFGHVIGLERSDYLHELAKANLMRFRIRPRARVELILGDALEYELPDGVTVLFFYNLFDGRTFELFMQRIFASVDRSSRRLWFVYVNPKEHDYLLKTGRCRLVKRFRGLRPTRTWARALATHIYEIAPDSSISEARTINHAFGQIGPAMPSTARALLRTSVSGDRQPVVLPRSQDVGDGAQCPSETRTLFVEKVLQCARASPSNVARKGGSS